MDIENIEYYKEIKKLAEYKGYNIIVKELKVDRFGERALASHFVNYKSKEIEISLPPKHKEMIELFIHELIHAELFLNGYPRLLRSPEITYTELDELFLEEIENLAQHYLLYPKMKSMGYEHSQENDKFIRNIISSNLQRFARGSQVIIDGFLILEAEYRNQKAFKSIENQLYSNNPSGYGFYRSIKKIYSQITNQRSMRGALIKVIHEVENRAKIVANIELNYNEKVNIKPVPTEHEMEQFCSEYYKLVKHQGLEHHYIYDKRDNQCVMILESHKYTEQEINLLLSERKVKELFK